MSSRGGGGAPGAIPSGIHSTLVYLMADWYSITWFDGLVSRLTPEDAESLRLVRHAAHGGKNALPVTLVNLMRSEHWRKDFIVSALTRLMVEIEKV
jgi:hypothetical protein